MASPFPGMDPFIEGQIWEDFHHALVEAIRESMIPRVRPRYLVRVEEREGGEAPAGGATATATLVGIAPVMRTVPMPERQREAFLTVRERDTMEVVTVIELLCPGNKRGGSDARHEYLAKREAVLLSATHLVELDLLRRGERLPTIETLPAGDYYAFVCRGQRRPKAEVYFWSLRQRLPTIPVPLAGNDPDVMLDLQAAFTAVYDRAGYDYSLDYRRPVEPPLSDNDIAWAQQLLAAAAS